MSKEPRAWTTDIGEVEDGEYALRGQKVTGLMESGDWVGTMLLALLGHAPTEAERTLLSACLIAAIDHGIAPPSAHVTRVVASCGKPVADSVAAGLLTLGPRHGNAASASAQWFMERVSEGADVRASALEAIEGGVRLSGFGHAEYQRDPRGVTLAKLAAEALTETPHMDFALAVADVLTEQKGKPLYLNVDGAIGAIVADLGLSAEMADVIFLLGRTVGLCAHAMEEAPLSKSYRRQK